MDMDSADPMVDQNEEVGAGVDVEGMETDVVQWATLGPQNTLITFQALPLGFEGMEGGAAITIGEAADLAGLSEEKLEAALLPVPDSHPVTDASTVSLEDDKMSVPASVATFLAQTVSSKSQSLDSFADFQSCLTTQSQSKPLSIFSSVTATLSPLLMNTIAGSQAILLQQVQTEPGLQLNIQGSEHFTITGSLETVMRVHNKMKEVLGEADKLQFTDTLPDPTSSFKNVCDKAVTCDLLVPFISSHGRQVRKPARYSGSVQLGFSNGLELGDDFEEDGDDEDFPGGRRRRRGNQARQSAASSHSEDQSTPATLQASQTLATDQQLLAPQQLLADDSEASAAEAKQEGSQAAGEEKQAADWSTSSRRPGLRRKARLKKDYEALAPFKFRCTQCSFKTKRESHFQRHMKYHERDDVALYKCSQCSFVTIRFSHLRRHEIEHSQQVYRCPHCKYRTDHPHSLERHVRYKHKPQKSRKPRFTCSQCNFCTQQKARYDWHVMKHLEAVGGPSCVQEEGEKSFKCTECAYVTMRREHLQRHMENVHGNLRPYLCDLCGKAFKRTDALNQHKFTHQARDARRLPFTCTLCTKAFRSQAHLKEHMSMHTTDRPYLCHHCGAAFKTPGVQRRHIASIHLNPRAFDCSSCSKRFNTKYALMRHQRTHTTAHLPAEVGLEVEGEGEGGVLVGEGEVGPLVGEGEGGVLVEEGDVMQAAMEETLVQATADSLEHPYMQSSETTEALLFLENGLTL